MRLAWIAPLLLVACGGDDTNQPSGSWTVGSGVDIVVTDLIFSGDVARVSFEVKDGAGTPLDISGARTDGPVDVSFVLAQLAIGADGLPGQYTAYTTRTVEKRYPTPDSSITAVQATNESVMAGKLDVVAVTEGKYRYTFAASVKDRNPNLLQSVLAVAVREVGETEAIDRDLFSTGGIAREEVVDQTCNNCHGSFAEHGGRYTSTQQCVLCHTEQTRDPDTGNTVDFRVMIHKIHAGEFLPSHEADARNNYTIIGFNGSVHSYGNVAMPGPAENGTNHARCETCHAAAAQGDVWLTRASITACTSCHDTTTFTAEANPPYAVPHQGGVDPALVNESTCVVCHGATSGIAPVTTMHHRGVFAADFTKIDIGIDSIANTGPGQLPTVVFRVMVNGAPRNLLTAPLTTLSATLAGPTTDIEQYWQARIQGAGAVGTLAPLDPDNGWFSYTFPATGCTDALTPNRACAIPEAATGSYEIGLEGYIQPPGGERATVFPPVFTFAVTDAAPVPRRVIVTEQKCNQCHLDLRAHGGSRKNPNYCVFCHNPNKAGDTRAPRFEGREVLALSVDMRVFIHKIHMGEELSQPYVLGGFPAPSPANPGGAPLDFGETRYPRARTDCEACHVAKNWTLPMMNSPRYLPSTLLEMTCNEPPGADPDMFCQGPSFMVARAIKIQPQTSVCTSCHDAPHTFAHALVNTTSEGAEACATCHGVGMTWDVSVFHGSP